jgi:hypothetical protein
MSAWRKISMKVPNDVISSTPGQPVGRIRNKGETVRKYSIGVTLLASESLRHERIAAARVEPMRA